MAKAQVIFRDFSEGWKKRVLEPAIDKALALYAEVIRATIQENFGSEGGGVVGVTKTGRNIYVGAPAGSFPGKRSSRLVNSIAYKRIEFNEYTVGTNVGYGRMLEYGTSKMKARPWLFRSLREGHSTALRMFAQKMVQEMGL